MRNGAELVDALGNVGGPRHVPTAADDQEPYLFDCRGRAVAVARPADTEQVAAVVRLCAERGVVVVPRGGNTGMCGAATPPTEGRSVVVRLDRMDRVRAA